MQLHSHAACWLVILVSALQVCLFRLWHTAQSLLGILLEFKVFKGRKELAFLARQGACFGLLSCPLSICLVV
jgi:hypothetical protein